MIFSLGRNKSGETMSNQGRLFGDTDANARMLEAQAVERWRANSPINSPMPETAHDPRSSITLGTDATPEITPAWKVSEPATMLTLEEDSMVEEEELRHTSPRKNIHVVPDKPAAEKTPTANFGISPEEDIKRRFGNNIRSALGTGTVIEGMFKFDSPVCIDGTMKGEVSSTSALIVGSQAQVDAHLKVGSIIIIGNVVGDIDADDLVEIRSTGQLCGDIRARRFAIEDGGIFNGSCRMK